jgi:hypothetical protein
MLRAISFDPGDDRLAFGPADSIAIRVPMMLKAVEEFVALFENATWPTLS